jgi:copper transport protein
MSRKLGALPLVLCVAAVAVLSAPSSAGAHAELVSAEPADGSTVARAPGEIRLRFSEEISPRFRVVRLLDGRGRVVAGTSVRMAGDGRGLIAHAPRMPRGTYEVMWEVLAQDDGHVTGGATVFGVGAAPGTAPRRAPGAGAKTPDVLLRWVDFALLALMAGGFAMSRVLQAGSAGHASGGDPPAPRERAPAGAAWTAARGRTLAVFAWCGWLALLFGLVLLARQAAVLPGNEPLPDAVVRLLGARWGALWLAREVLLAALAAVGLVLLRHRPPLGSSARAAVQSLPLLLVPALFTIRALGGHAAAVAEPGAHVAADAIHALTAAVWLGGVACFAVAVWPAGAVTRAGSAVVAGACRRPFALMAGLSVGLVAATGLYSAGAQITSVDGLLTTGWGETLLAKSALALLAGAIGAANALLLRRAARHRSRSSPRLIALEAAIGLGVLLAAAELTSGSPPRGPEFLPPTPVPAPELARQVGDVVVSATARPNRAGPNVVTVLAASSRRPAPAPIAAIAVRLVEPGTGAGGTQEVALQPLGGGRWSGGAELPAEGGWAMTVVIHRGGQILRAPFRWRVAPPATSRPVVISARPLAPIVDRVALFIVFAVVATALGIAATPRLRRLRRHGAGAVAAIEPVGKEAT